MAVSQGNRDLLNDPIAQELLRSTIPARLAIDEGSPIKGMTMPWLLSTARHDRIDRVLGVFAAGCAMLIVCLCLLPGWVAGERFERTRRTNDAPRRGTWTRDDTPPRGLDDPVRVLVLGAAVVLLGAVAWFAGRHHAPESARWGHRLVLTGFVLSVPWVSPNLFQAAWGVGGWTRKVSSRLTPPTTTIASLPGRQPSWLVGS